MYSFSTSKFILKNKENKYSQHNLFLILLIKISYLIKKLNKFKKKKKENFIIHYKKGT